MLLQESNSQQKPFLFLRYVQERDDFYFYLFSFKPSLDYIVEEHENAI